MGGRGRGIAGTEMGLPGAAASRITVPAAGAAPRWRAPSGAAGGHPGRARTRPCSAAAGSRRAALPPGSAPAWRTRWMSVAEK